MLEGRYPYGCCCIFDGNRKPYTYENPLICRVQNPGDNANDLAI